jgi:phosphatidylglycerol:prolipoprotein diacylglycerol transferase
LHPELLHIGRFVIPTYGVLAAAGLIIGLYICVRYAKREGLNEEQCWNMGVISIFAGIAGAKLLFIVFSWSETTDHWRQVFSFNMLQTGGVWYGGLIGAVTAGTIYTIWHRWPVLTTADAYAPGIAFGHSLGRLGCLAAGCCYGKPTDASWGIVFHNPIANRLTGTPLNVRLHPTQIYEWAAEFAIFLLLVWMYKRRSFHGQIAATYLFLFGIARFVIEFWRDDPERGSVFGGAISGTQLISILLVVFAGALWVYGSQRQQSVPAHA